MIEKSNFFVFTGGPGVGKTTLLRHLETLGELVVEENARAVIREQSESGGRGVPWLDNEAFCRLTHERDLAAFEARTHETRRVFFDRGIMDMVDANGTPPWPELLSAVATRRYNARIFVFPPWREIYQTDNERRQDWREAEATFSEIMRRLPTLGYAPDIVPVGTLEARAAYVRERAG